MFCSGTRFPGQIVHDPLPGGGAPAVSRRRAPVRGGLKSEVESDGGLCEVGDLVELQTVDREVRHLVYESTIFGAFSKVPRDVEIHSVAVEKPRLRLRGSAADES